MEFIEFLVWFFGAAITWQLMKIVCLLQKLLIKAGEPTRFIGTLSIPKQDDDADWWKKQGRESPDE